MNSIQRRVLPLLVIVLVLASPAVFEAQEPNLLASAEWVQAHLGDESLVLLHVGPLEDFASAHIPGAVHLGNEAFSHPGSHTEESLILELPEPGAFQTALRERGVSDDSRIVVYWGEEWVSPTARALFTLDWAGLGDRTRLLDGGLTAWKAAGLATSSESASPEMGDVTIQPRDVVVGAEWVQAHAEETGYQLVDARAAAFFDGVREDRGVPGHIPGAGSLPWTELVDEETLLLQPREKLQALLASAGVRDGDTVVGYCHIGQYATLVLLTARILGHEVLLYDGAFQDWARRELPVESAP